PVASLCAALVRRGGDHLRVEAALVRVRAWAGSGRRCSLWGAGRDRGIDVHAAGCRGLHDLGSSDRGREPVLPAPLTPFQGAAASSATARRRAAPGATRTQRNARTRRGRSERGRGWTIAARNENPPRVRATP